MSTEDWAGLGVGYRIVPTKLPDRFRRHVPEQVVFEDRYDPKSGQKLPEPERVVLSEAHDVWLLDGTEYQELEDFFVALAKKVGGVCDLWGDYEAGNLQWSIELPGSLLSHDPNDDDIDPDLIAKHWDLLVEIGHRLRALGIDTGRPKIFSKLSRG